MTHSGGPDRYAETGVGMVAIVPRVDVATARALVPGLSVLRGVAGGAGAPTVRYGGRPRR